MRRTVYFFVIVVSVVSLFLVQSCGGSEKPEKAMTSVPTVAPAPTVPTASNDPVKELVTRMHELMHSKGHQLSSEERSQVLHYDSLSQNYIHGGQRQEGIQCLEAAISILEGRGTQDVRPSFPQRNGNAPAYQQLAGPGNDTYRGVDSTTPQPGHPALGDGSRPGEEWGGNARYPEEQGGFSRNTAWAQHQGQGGQGAWPTHEGYAAGNTWNAYPPHADAGNWQQGQAARDPWGYQTAEAQSTGGSEQALGVGYDTATTDMARTAAMSSAAGVGDSSDSPFGFHPLRAPGPAEYAHAHDLGVYWDRGSLYMFWFLAQPDPKSPRYDWSKYDQLMQSTPASINTLWNISTAPDPLREPDNPYTYAGSYMPRDPEAYKAFVRAAVERYNGDGRNDMPGLKSPVKFWQVGNEPDLGPNKDYAKFVAMTYQAIKEADPEAKVLIGGVSGFAPVEEYLRDFDNRYAPFLRELGGRYVDIFAFHFFGTAAGDYLGYKPVLEHIRRTLVSCGFPPDMEIWCTETSTYGGSPTPVPQLNFRQFPPQSEADQAADLFKRYIYGVRCGIKRLFWAFGLVEGFKHDGSFFDYTGIVKPDGRKKLAYHTLKLMTHKLADADWRALRPLQEHQDNTYVYEIPRKSGNPIYVAWKDGAVGGEVSLAMPDLPEGCEAKVTTALTDQNGNPRVKTVSVNRGVVRVDLGTPVFIETQQ